MTTETDIHKNVDAKSYSPKSGSPLPPLSASLKESLHNLVGTTGETPRPVRVASLGAGYVGAPTMAVMALHCPDIEVYVLDLSQERIDGYNSGNFPIFEPRFAEVVEQCRGRNLFFSTDIAKYIEICDIIFVSVNTPTKLSGIGAGEASDLSYWEAGARTIALHAKSPKIIVEKSTVPIKTATALDEVLSANEKPGVWFTVLSNPEFMAEGTAIDDLFHPDRILIGGQTNAVGRDAVKIIATIYARWVPASKILTTDVWSAELSKLVANAFLAQRISSINSVTELCASTGANVDEVARAVGMDKRIGPHFLKASVGFGGSCFKKDVLNLVYILSSMGYAEAAEYWRQVVEFNEFQKTSFAKKMLDNMYMTMGGKKIAIFGFAFKKDTADVRETAAAKVCFQLLKEGARIHVYDPKVSQSAMVQEFYNQRLIGPQDELLLKKFVSESCPEGAVKDADAIAILTEWDEFKNYNYKDFFIMMRKPAKIFDGRNILDRQKMASIGFTVHSTGMPTISPSSSADVSIPIYSMDNLLNPACPIPTELKI